MARLTTVGYFFRKINLMAIDARPFNKDWPEIFNNDTTLTSAILDRLLHHAETDVIQGKSYRMKEKIEL